MHIKNIFQQYMLPFLKENGFTLLEKISNEFTYTHVENSDALIYFTIEKERISAEFSHKGRPGCTPLYNLSMFIEDPEFPDPPALDSYWRFDNEEQLVGALEEQMILLREKVIPWLMDESKVDVDNIVRTSAMKRSIRWKSSTEEERVINFSEFEKNITKWENRRVLPKRWGKRVI